MHSRYRENDLRCLGFFQFPIAHFNKTEVFCMLHGLSGAYKALATIYIADKEAKEKKKKRKRPSPWKRFVNFFACGSGQIEPFPSGKTSVPGSILLRRLCQNIFQQDTELIITINKQFCKAASTISV